MKYICQLLKKFVQLAVLTPRSHLIVVAPLTSSNACLNTFIERLKFMMKMIFIIHDFRNEKTLFFDTGGILTGFVILIFNMKKNVLFIQRPHMVRALDYLQKDFICHTRLTQLVSTIVRRSMHCIFPYIIVMLTFLGRCDTKQYRKSYLTSRN